MCCVCLISWHTAQKRHIFDSYGEEGLKSRGGSAGTSPGSYTFHRDVDPHKIFAQFFGGRDPFSVHGFGEGFQNATFQYGNGPAQSFQFTPPRGEEGMDFTPSGGVFMSNGFGSGSKRPRPPQQDPPIEYPLNVSLEELFSGCTKKIKISRKLLNPDGTSSQETKFLTVDIKRGWKAGTKITYAKEGDQNIGRTPADVVFILQEKPHLLFTRKGNDLHHTIKLSLHHALCGVGSVEVPTIEGGAVNLPLNEIITPETKMTIPGHGMPLSKEHNRRGDLIVDFNIAFPKHLSPSDKSELAKLLPVQ